MLSLSPTLAKRCADALETVSRAPLLPLSNRETPRNLSAIPPSVRRLPPSLQIVALCDMLADAQEEISRQQVGIRMRDRDKNELHDTLAETRKELERVQSILNRVYAERDALDGALSR